MPTPLKRLTSRLAELLKNHDKQGARARRITYQTLPLVTCMKFEGEPLRRVMSPPVPETGSATLAIFDAWLYHLKIGDGEGGKDLIAAGYEDLLAFIDKGETFADKTVRLLYALGNAEGAVLTYDATSVKVQHEDRSYGIANGVVFSRHCSGLLIPCNPKPALEDAMQVRTFDRYFCSLYREAYRVGKGAKEALIALYTGNPNVSLHKVFKAESLRKLPTQKQIVSFENTLNHMNDPLARIYKQIVPEFMSSAEFSKVFGTLSLRPDTLSERAKQRYINKMNVFFHKTKKESKPK